MKNENEIKRAFAMEVIDELKSGITNGQLTKFGEGVNYGFQKSIDIIQSLLPKEEEVDWSKASEDKRLRHGVINYAQYVSHYVGLNGDVCAIDEYNKTVVLYSKSSNKWAEIETKTESDEVKAGDEVECKELVGEVWERGYIYLGVKTSTGLYVVECEGGGVGLAEQIRKPQPTLEQRARKQAEEMYYKIESSQEAIYQALLIDPKKL